jgi:cell division protein ZapA (FtsZ GTPase activity inhibitor)
MINAIHNKIPDQPTLTVAVLSALNITEDLFKEKERAKAIESEVGKMTAYLDNCLREGGSTHSS